MDAASLAMDFSNTKMGFYVHLSVYVAVNVGLFFIWLFTGGLHGVFPWFVFPFGGWGIGLIAHGLSVFAHTDYLDRMTEQEYRKLKADQKRKITRKILSRQRRNRALQTRPPIAGRIMMPIPVTLLMLTIALLNWF